VSRTRRRVATAIMVALASCAPVDARSGLLPGGVIMSSDVSPGALVGGIYASAAPNDPSCCWTQRATHFSVRKDGPATDFSIRIYLPPVAAFERRPQGFVAVIERTHSIERCCFGPGLHTVLFPLPADLRTQTGTLDVALTMRTTFVPSRARLARDSRTLAVILRSAGFVVF
jgi:hypothetical protein